MPDYEHYAYHKHGRITAKTNAVSHEILTQQTKTMLQSQYMNNTWKVRLEESSKLEFYREVKQTMNLKSICPGSKIEETNLL